MKPVYLILFLFTGTLIMMSVMRWQGNALSESPRTKAGILSLEFAKTKQQSDAITTNWKNKQVHYTAIVNTSVDFVFIFFYSLFLFAASYWFSLRQKGSMKKLSQKIALFGLTAGLLDCVENYFLLKMLKYTASDAETNFTFWIASIKFVLAAIAVLWILLQVLLLFIQKLKPSHHDYTHHRNI